jgi:single-strand DNA-binding protein
MKAYGIGRLTREIELKSSTSGTSYLANSIACDRKYSKEKVTDFFNIKAFGKVAEGMDKWLHKGSKIFIEGDIQVDEYTDKNGIKKSTTSIVVSSWEFAEGKGETKDQVTEDAKSFLNVPDSLLETLPFS